MCNITFRPDLDLVPRILVDLFVSGLQIILCIVITAITYFHAVFSVKKLPKAHFQKINSGIHKLLWYPALLFVLFMPSLVDQFALMIDPTMCHH